MVTVPPDVAQILTLYYLVGLAWLTTGFLPWPVGWLHHRMSFLAILAYVAFCAAIWPWIAGKIVYLVFWRGEMEIEL